MASTDNIRLSEILEHVSDGRIQLPEFQRNWVWDDERIRALIATVTLDYPLGVIMTLSCGDQPLFKARPLAGTEPERITTGPKQLLLDGQQRITSLFQAFASGRPTVTRSSRGAQVECWYYLDVDRAVDPEADREDAIIAVPANRSLRAGALRESTVDLTTADAEVAARLFPLHLAFDIEARSEWQQKFVDKDPARNWPVWTPLVKILDHIANFRVPAITLASDTDKVAVCSVFERVNTGGVVLTVFELLTASYAGDRKYSQENGRDFHLAEHWTDIQSRLRDKWPALWDLKETDFLMALALVNSFKKRRTVGCKRKDLLDLPLEDYLRHAPDIEQALHWCGAFLLRRGIYDGQDLPYRTQLVPLAAIRAVLGERTDDPGIEQLIARWYWCGVFGELYGGSIESRFPRDVEQVVGWVDGGPEPDTVAEASFNRQRLDTMATRNSAAYKGMIGLLIKSGAVDWYYTEKPMTVDSAMEQEVEIRQIFSKAWAERNGLKNDPRITSIVNKTVLSQRAFRIMDGSTPTSYLDALARESGIPAAWMDDTVTTHFIDPKALRASDFDTFYTHRAEQLTMLVQASMDALPEPGGEA